MSRAATASLLFLATLSGCSSLSRNHERGLAAVGAVATLFGATTIADGMSCDSRYHHGSTCTTDRGELRDGAIITTAGVALFGAGLWLLVTDGRPDEDARPRAVRPATTTTTTTASRLAPRD